jgi:HAD superfamily hydrolase (TIGR01509 family)
MTPQVILFDLDGVLLDACDWHYEALNNSLLYFGYSAIRREDHISTFNGLPTKVKLKMLGISHEDALKINEKKQKYTIDIIKNNAFVMEEKIKLHKYLKSQGIKIACVTNSIKETATEMLVATGQMPYIDLLVTNEQITRNKPHPDCYNYAIEILGANPNKCLCVEDSPKGIEAAEASVASHIWVVKNSSEVNKNNYVKFVEKKQ